MLRPVQTRKSASLPQRYTAAFYQNALSNRIKLPHANNKNGPKTEKTAYAYAHVTPCKTKSYVYIRYGGQRAHGEEEE